MGPCCDIVLQTAASSEVHNIVDAYLGRVAKQIVRHRKGRTWELWLDGRPISVFVSDQKESSPAMINFAASCNSPEDYALLRRLSGDLAVLLGGIATEPVK